MYNDILKKKKLAQSSKKLNLKKNYTFQIRDTDDSKKNNDIISTNFQIKCHENNTKINKNPINIRQSFKGKSKTRFLNILNHNTNQKPIKKDKNYYLNLLNDLYLNDQHLSNNNIIRFNKNDKINLSNKLVKKKTFNVSKIMNIKDNNNSKPKLSIISKNTNFDIKEEEENKNSSINSKDDKVNPFKRYISEEIASKFKTSQGLIKINNNKSKLKKLKSYHNINSLNIKNILKEENDESKDTIQKELKNVKINNNENKNKKSKKENKNEKKVIKNSRNNLNNNQKTNKKDRKSCFFCCFTVDNEDDSF